MVEIADTTVEPDSLTVFDGANLFLLLSGQPHPVSGRTIVVRQSKRRPDDRPAHLDGNRYCASARWKRSLPTETLCRRGWSASPCPDA